MSNQLALATYGLVRGDGGQSSRAEPNTSAAAATHQSHMASQSRARAAQLLQAELAPPMMTVQAMSLDRHLGQRYIPHQVPFASLSCGEYLSVQDVQSLAAVFDKYNILPNNQQAESVNDPEVFSTASRTASDRARHGASTGGGGGVDRTTTSGAAGASSPSPITGTAPMFPAGSTSATSMTGTASTSASPPPQPTPSLQDTSKLSYAARRSAARVLETKLTRDEDDKALCVEWVVELLLDMIAARMDAKDLERDRDAQAEAETSARRQNRENAVYSGSEDERGGGGGGAAAADTRRASLSQPLRGLSRHPSRRRASTTTSAADAPGLELHGRGYQSWQPQQQRTAKLRRYRAELLAWIAPLSQVCDARRQSTVFESGRRQQQMFVQYQRSVLEAELLRARRYVDAVPNDAGLPSAATKTAASSTTTTTAMATEGEVMYSRTGKGFHGVQTPLLSYAVSPTLRAMPMADTLPQFLPVENGEAQNGRRMAPTNNNNTNNNHSPPSRRSPAAINFLDSLALPETTPAGPVTHLTAANTAAVMRSPSDEDMGEHESVLLDMNPSYVLDDGSRDKDRPAYTGHLNATRQAASTAGSSVWSPVSQSRGRRALAMMALDTLLPPTGTSGNAMTTAPTTTTATTTTATPAPTTAAAAAETAALLEAAGFFLPACYLHNAARLAAERREEEAEKSAVDMRRSGRLSVSLPTTVAGGVGGGRSNGGEVDGAGPTRPPSASTAMGRAGTASSAATTVGAAAAMPMTMSPAASPTSALPSCGLTWLEALSDLPAWGTLMRGYLDRERHAVGTQTLEEVVLSLASAAASANAANSTAASATASMETSSPMRTSSFRRPPGYARLAQLPRVPRDAVCRVICWTDLSNNFVLDHQGSDHQGGFLEHTYVRGPSMMLEGDDPHHLRDTAAAHDDTDGLGDGVDEDTDENSEEALLSTIHGGARRRRAASRRVGGASGGVGAFTSADDLAQHTAVVTDVATFAEELKGLHRQSADHVVVTSNGALIITSSKDGVVKSWDGQFGQFRANVLNVGTAWVLAMSLVREEQVLLVATSNAELTLVELATTHVVHKYRGCTSLLTALRAVVQPDAQHITKYGMKPGECGPHRISYESGTSAEGYHTLREREVELTRQTVTVPVQPIEGFVSPSAFFFCEETSFAFFGTNEGVVGCVDLSGELRHSASLVAKSMQPLSLVFSARAHASGIAVTGLCFSTATGCVVSSGHDGTLARIPFVRDTQTGQYSVGAAAPVPVFQPTPIRFMVFHPHARLVATSHSDRRVQLWMLTRTSVELVHQFPQETHDIVSVVFLRCEERIAMLLTDHSLRVFDVRGYRPSAVITTRSTSDQQLQDMASVTLKLSATDADGCVGYHASSRRLVCALRSPILYIPSGGPRIEGSRRETEEKRKEDTLTTAAATNSASTTTLSPAERSKSGRRRSRTRASSKTALGGLIGGTGRGGVGECVDKDDEHTGSRSVSSQSSNSSSSADSEDSLGDFTALRTLHRQSVNSQAEGTEITGVLSRRESLEVLERVEHRRQARATARAAKKQRLAAAALLARRLAPHTTHHRGSVIGVVVVPDRLQVHTFTSDRWKVWSLATGVLVHEMELPREVRRAFPRFRRAVFVCSHWSTASCSRMLLGGQDGVLATVDPETGLLVLTEQLSVPSVASPTARATAATTAVTAGTMAAPTAAGGTASAAKTTATTTGTTGTSATAGSANAAASTTPHHTTSHEAGLGGGNKVYIDNDKDITVIACEKQRAFLCTGRHCVVRRYQADALDAHGAEEFTSLTLTLPPSLNTSITACCVVRDTHICLGTMDGHMLFYRLSDQSAPYAEEFVRETYPDGAPDVGSITGLCFLNEKNQGLVVAVTSTGVMHVYAYLKGAFVGRLRVCRAHECYVSAVHFHRQSSLLVLGDSLGRVRLFDLTGFVSDATNFKRALRACGTIQGATSEVTALTLVCRHLGSSSSTAPPTTATSTSTSTATATVTAEKRPSVGAAAGASSVLSPSPTPVWLLVAATDGNVRLFLWRPAPSVRGGASTTTTGYSFAATGATPAAATAAVMGSPLTGPGSLSLAAMPRTSLVAGGVGDSVTVHNPNMDVMANGSFGAEASGARVPVLVGLFGCDVWALGEESSYSVGMALPVEEVSTRQREAQAVLEEVMRLSKPVMTTTTAHHATATNGTTTTTGAPAITSTTAAPAAAAVSARDTTPKNTTSATTATPQPISSTHAAKKKAGTAPAEVAVPSSTSASAVPAGVTRSVHALLPCVRSENTSPTTYTLTVDANVSAAVGGVGPASLASTLPASVALDTRRTQKDCTPIDASAQRRISAPHHDPHNKDDKDPHAKSRPPLEAGRPDSAQTGRGRRSTMATAIASVLCGTEDDRDDGQDSGENSVRAGVTRSRHETLLLAAAAAASAGPASASSAADATYAAAHPHMSSTSPNPLLQTYPIALLRKLGVLLPNQGVPEGDGEEAALPAELAFDPVRLRAYMRAGQPRVPSGEVWRAGEHETPDSEASRGRRPTAVMTSAPEAEAAAAAAAEGHGPSFFLTDIAADAPPAASSGADGRPGGGPSHRLSSTRTSAASTITTTTITTRSSLRGTHTPTAPCLDVLARTRITEPSLEATHASDHTALTSTMTPQQGRPPPAAAPVAPPPLLSPVRDAAAGPSAHHSSHNSHNKNNNNNNNNTNSTTMRFAATTSAHGLASLAQPSRVLPSAMRAASASSPRSGTRLPGSAVASPSSRGHKPDVITVVNGCGSTGGGGHRGDFDDALQSPLTLSVGDRSRLGGAPGASTSVVLRGSPLSTLHGQKRQESDTVAFPEGLPPLPILEERRDQLMLAHLARQLDHLQPKGSTEGGYMMAIEKTWRRRRGDAATRAAATGAGAASGQGGGGGGGGGSTQHLQHASQQPPPQALLQNHNAVDAMSSTSTSLLGPAHTTTMGGGGGRASSFIKSKGSLHQGRVGASPADHNLLLSPRPASSSMRTDGEHPSSSSTPAGGFTGLDLALLACPTETSVVARPTNTTSNATTTTTTTTAALLPAHERMRQHIQQTRKMELQALRDRLAAREEQESQHRSRTRRPGAGPAASNTGAAAASAGGAAPARTLPRGRDELPLISGRQRLDVIDVALPSTLARDEGAKLQLRQLKALSGASNHAATELSSAAPGPHRQRLSQ